VALNKLNHIYGEPLVVSSLNVLGSTVLDSTLTVLGESTFASASIGAVTNTQIQYLAGLTSDVQTQLNGKVTAAQVASLYAPLAGAAFTGAISATDLTLTNDLTIANGGTGLSATTKGGIYVGNSTTAFTNVTVGLDGYLLTADSAQATGLKWAAAPVSLPSQTGNTGKYLTTDGSSASWATLQALPTQTGNSGKFLTTDATTASWATLTASNLTGGTLSSTILGNSTVYIGTTAVALNRTTANLGLTGISSVAFPGSTSGTTTVQASAAAGTTTFTLPATTGTGALQGDTTYVGTTAVTLNRSSANLALTGITSVTLPGNLNYTTTIQGSGSAVVGGNTTFTLPTVTGTAALQADVHYIGTTSIALNRASASQTLTGVSIDGNAATATTASSVTNGLTTSNYSSYALPLAGGTMTGLVVGSPTAAGVTILNSNDNGNFSVRSISSSSTSPASMSFHRPGLYAINMGLDTDNVFKIGGWSAGIIMMSLSGAGNMTLPGTLTINSDARLKENLTPLTDALDKVKALTGYNYNRIGSDVLQMGVVAQEVQKVAPELVLEDSEGTLSVSYQNMVALLIEAIKEQSIQIASLEEQVKELRG
jgi:hypothetical protein